MDLIFIYKKIGWMCFCALLLSCAQRVTPSGGPKDTTAPEPLNGKKYFYTQVVASQMISIPFNEPIQIKTPAQISIYPLLSPAPSITTKGKELLIKLPSSMPSQTTFHIQIANTIADLTESNTFPAIEIYVSTSPKVDTIKCRGNIQGLSKTDFLFTSVYLIPTTDENLKLTWDKKTTTQVKAIPNGTYNISAVKPQKYTLVAHEDVNQDGIYQPYKERIGFYPSVIDITKDTVLNITMFRETPPRPMPIAGSMLSPQSSYILFSEKVPSITSVKTMPASKDTLHYRSSQDTLYIHHARSIKGLTFVIQSNATDTISVELPTRNNKNQSKQNKPQLQISNSISSYQSLIITSDAPHFINNYRILEDGKIVRSETLSHGWQYQTTIKYDWKVGKKYSIQLPNIKHFVNNAKDSVSHAFTVNTGTAQGTLIITEMKLWDRYNTIEIVSKDMTKTIANAEFQAYPYTIVLPAGSYTLRAYQDLNRNDKYDNGSLNPPKLPEPKYVYAEPLKITSVFKQQIKILK